MNRAMLEVVIKRFESPDETRTMEKRKFELVRLGGMTVGRATYQPGWKWSEHVGPGVGASRCSVEHVGMVVSGCATAAFDDGTVVEMKPGELFHIPPVPHDSWVVGNVPYVSTPALRVGFEGPSVQPNNAMHADAPCSSRSLPSGKARADLRRAGGRGR